jgi:protein-S-isoprenylcysteine O-methyltransferase Ste14
MRATPDGIVSVPARARWGRWLGFTTVMAAAALGLAGRTDLPGVNATLVLFALFGLAAMLVIDPALLRERFRLGQKGEDPVRLALIRGLFLLMLVFALLDVGRVHWSDRVPAAVQAVALGVGALAFGWTLWAIRSNPFFLPVIRVQSERGHHVVRRGPYARVRHPGYLGMALGAAACPLAIGSWGALGPGLALSVLFVLRAAHEDRFLAARLPGYDEYARQVRRRLVPGVW